MKGWIAIRDTAKVYEKYSVTATPTLFIIDKNGYIRYQHVGVTESSVLMSEVWQPSLAKSCQEHVNVDALETHD